MTTGETIKELINAENYAQHRITISDEFINFVKVMLPRDYEYISEKEDTYQDLLNFLKNLE